MVVCSGIDNSNSIRDLVVLNSTLAGSRISSIKS